MSIFSSTNILFIEQMSVLLSIGAFDCEFNQRQNCEVSIAIEVDGLDRIKRDDLSETYDYGQVVEIVKSLSKKHYQLVEYLAQDIAKLIFKSSLIKSVEVKIAKPGAFVNISSCGCKIKFLRDSF